MLDEHGDEIEADLARYYQVNLVDFYRGRISARRLSVLIQQLPAESRLVTALNDGKPVWTVTDNLLADVWSLLVKVNSDPKKTPADLDHPARKEMRAKVTAAAKQKLKDVFRRKRAQYTMEVTQ